MFFVKSPEPGEVKTRLAKESTPEEAAEFYKVFAKDKLSELKEAVDGDLIAFYTPEAQRKPVEEWLGSDCRLIAQKGTELGRRMENAFREAFFMGYERAIIVGSDIPGLTSEIITTAFASLGPGKACIGPAEDGGYYLIGFHRNAFVPQIFHDIEWGKSDVYQRTVNRLEDIDVEFLELKWLDDMDTYEDVETMAALGKDGPLKGRALELAKKMTGM